MKTWSVDREFLRFWAVLGEPECSAYHTRAEVPFQGWWQCLHVTVHEGCRCHCPQWYPTGPHNTLVLLGSGTFMLRAWIRIPKDRKMDIKTSGLLHFSHAGVACPQFPGDVFLLCLKAWLKCGIVSSVTSWGSFSSFLCERNTNTSLTLWQHSLARRISHVGKDP